MSDAAGHLPPGIEAVVGDDGQVIISSEQTARLGLKPGTHLRLVPATPLQTLDDLFAAGDARREVAGVQELSGDGAAQLADEATKEVRLRLYTEA